MEMIHILSSAVKLYSMWTSYYVKFAIDDSGLGTNNSLTDRGASLFVLNIDYVVQFDFVMLLIVHIYVDQLYFFVYIKHKANVVLFIKIYMYIIYDILHYVHEISTLIRRLSVTILLVYSHLYLKTHHSNIPMMTFNWMVWTPDPEKLHV